MKNLKNFAFGLLVAVLAVGFSAFTSKSSQKIVGQLKKGAITSDYIVQPSLDDFREYTAAPVPNDLLCDDSATKDCIYHVTEDGKMNIPEQPSGYSAQDIQDFLDNDWLEPVPNANQAIYDGPYQ